MPEKSKTKNKNNNNNDYGAKDIYVLEGLDPVRKRPGMYIGSTGVDGLHHLIWEVVDNAIDEAMGGYAKNISVTLLPKNKVKVVDDGRGIPVETHKQTKKSALETVMTTLHAGAKFSNQSYKVAGGLHGVGVSVVNALSKRLRAEICRDGFLWAQEYERGKPESKVKKINKCEGTGTAVVFEPDPEIFKDIRFNWERILEHLRQQAYLTKAVKIIIQDQREENPLLHQYHAFYFEGGVRSYVGYLNRDLSSQHENLFYVEKNMEGINVEVALQYADDLQSRETSFANNIYTPEGGMHLTGFRTALTRTLNDYAKKNNFLKNGEDNLSGDDVREGLTAVVLIKLSEPQFEGQTKAKLGNPEARSAVESVFAEAFSAFLEEHPHDARAIIEKTLLALKARKAAKAAKDLVIRKGALEGLALPGKLTDCQTRHAEEAELYIVEGDSGGGCFSGDTQIALTDGRNVSFRELVRESKSGKKHYCYTIKKDGKIGIAEIQNPRLTKRSAQVVKVVLDTNEEIICTPDHKFMLRDGSYLQAADLKPGHSLMTLQRFFENNYQKLHEAVLNYNHKVKAIVPLAELMDVYDIEVPGTHNFALSSGVFVHNSAKQARNRRFQAILPLRGKILNIERARLDKVLSSKEIKSLIIALGAAIADDFDIEKLRYHKIVIMTDADVDGSHIRTLLLTLFYRYFRPVIEAGYLYIAQPPLYRIQAGKMIRYAYSDLEKDKAILELQKIKGQKTDIKTKTKGPGPESGPAGNTGGEEGEANPENVSDKSELKGISIQRYKGLGEMDPEQLWETTMDPERRVFRHVAIEDAEEANRTFDVLMGGEVAPRKIFIQTHAKAVQNLDV